MSNNIEQPSLFEDEEKNKGPIVCLGLTFKNDDERREYFREELRKKLPELKKIEGFPIGDDEDIIALSDPPYYTACPNPWINDFIEEWLINNRFIINRPIVDIEPYSLDVKEGKNDPIYLAHSYHTKVPYKALMRYILHYTNPGEIILDSFSGSGMTGVAAQMCEDKREIEALGYTVNNEGEIFERLEDGKLKKFSNAGKRNTILIDLSPAATFIAANYNKSTDTNNLSKQMLYELKVFTRNFEFAYGTILNDRKDRVQEMYDMLKKSNNLNDIREMYQKNKNIFGKINYVVYSDVFVCSNCTQEINYWQSTVNANTKEVRKHLVCPHCNVVLDKNRLERVWNYFYDKYINDTVKLAKQIPVLINYSYKKKRFEKIPDKYDLELINKIHDIEPDYWIPIDKLPNGHNLDQPQRSHGITNVNHFYTDRTLLILGNYLKQFKMHDSFKQFLLGSVLPKLTKMNRYMPQHGSRALVGPMANVLYFPPMFVENNVLDQFEFQSKKIIKGVNEKSGNIISTQTSTKLININSNSVDYIFIDPPFGANIMYSELNFIRESWFKVKTSNTFEVIENKNQNKSLEDYKHLMVESLKEIYRILKPEKYITIEFSNTKAAVWNAIQNAIQEAGFIIANVDALDKKRGGLYSMITAVGVKQDLIITAYKPGEKIRDKINSNSDTVQSVIDFVTNHLKYLPVYKGIKGNLSYIPERDPRIIYDRMIAFYIVLGKEIPLSSADFQKEMISRYPFRDGMIFLENQVAEYDKKRILSKKFVQMNIFVADENSAIEWLRQQLMSKPQTRQDLHPNFMKEIQHIAKHEILPELDILLEQNFLKYDGIEAVPSQIHGYLSSNYKDLRNLDKNDPNLKEKAKNRWYVPDPNKQADLEKLREKALLREFESYKQEIENNKKKLKQFRTEAIRTGFKKAWAEKDYITIVKIGSRLPESIIQEDDKLLMYYDNAQIRLGL